MAFAEHGGVPPNELESAQAAFARWRDVLRDERANAAEALPVAQADIRLDACLNYASTQELIRAKLVILDQELQDYLPGIARKCGLDKPR
jgi:hypothetical protein